MKDTIVSVKSGGDMLYVSLIVDNKRSVVCLDYNGCSGARIINNGQAIEVTMVLMFGNKVIQYTLDTLKMFL